MLGISINGARGLGDQIQFSSFPENYYRNTGQHVIDLDRAWIFDHNPFVVREGQPSQTVNLWSQPWPEAAGMPPNTYLAKPIFFSIADRTAGIFRHTAYLRHPRLYAYEDLPAITNRLVLHTAGKPGATVLSHMGEDHPRILSAEIIEHIRCRYRAYEIIQIGSKDDPDARVTDHRGLDDIWDTVKTVAQAAIFIGVDSGPSWIAACYPHIFNKKVLMQYPPEFLRTSFVPMHALVPHHHWHDASFTYYNRSPDDAGVTYSFLKL
jgi:hypothetical protein